MPDEDGRKAQSFRVDNGFLNADSMGPKHPDDSDGGTGYPATKQEAVVIAIAAMGQKQGS